MRTGIDLPHADGLYINVLRRLRTPVADALSALNFLMERACAQFVACDSHSTTDERRQTVAASGGTGDAQITRLTCAFAC